MSTDALIIPEPSAAPVPAGFHETVRERVEGVSDIPELVASQAQLEAAIAGYRRLRADTDELGKALAWVELQTGIALGKPERQAGPGRGKTVTRDGPFPKQRVAEFRRMAWPKGHRTAVAKAIREGQWTRRQRLAAVARLPKANGKGKQAIEGTTDSLQDLIDSGQQFACIYADPPWRYGNQATRASTGNHYETMSVENICTEPVAELAADNAHLHLWTTNAFLFDAREVIEAWGFEYKSCLVWVKPQMGIGNYWRVSHEFLLFGLRGRLPFADRGRMSWVEADRTEHSRKPDAVREAVEAVSPGPYLEMYGRDQIPGWTVYGNQIDSQQRFA